VRPFLGVSWTLAIEFIWYGFFALGFYLFGDRLGRVLDIFMPTLMLALATLSLLLDTRIPLGRPGMIYVCVFGFQVYRFLNGKMGGRALAINVAVFFAVTMFTNMIAFGVFPHPNMRLAPVLLSWTVSPLLFLLCALIRPIRESAILNHGLFPWFGNITYSIYLLHPIAIAVSLQYIQIGWDRPFAAGLTIILAMAGYYLVELPMIAAGRRLTERKPRATGAQPRTA
jgi:peptidoglycan/LPS O-acetylase OafA/YrhL